MSFEDDLRYFTFRLKNSRIKSSKWRQILNNLLKEARINIVRAGCEDLPIDLNKLAKHFGIEEIRETILDNKGKGRIINENGVFKIEINKKLPSDKKRFVIAHELSHFIVEKKEIKKNPRRVSRMSQKDKMSFKMIEEFCDIIAEEVLLPEKYLLNKIGSSNPSIKIVDEISKETKNTLELVAKKVIDTGLWRCRFFWWKIINENIIAVNGVPFLDEKMLAFCQITKKNESTIWKSFQSNDYYEGYDSMIIGDQMQNYKIQSLPIKDSEVLSMIVF